MTGELNQVSEAIGGLRAETAGLRREFSNHCEDDDRRHIENVTEARAMRAELVKLNETLQPLVKAVSEMAPIVAGVQMTRWKVAGALALVGVLLWVLGWVVQAAVAKLVGALLVKLGLV